LKVASFFSRRRVDRLLREHEITGYAMAPDIGAERAKQAAIDHLSKAKGTKALAQSVEREGPSYVVRLMPETRGILLFFMSYKCWVNASTGIVEKCK
jgi:hypothetical protein